jgi:hypothetical protein
VRRLSTGEDFTVEIRPRGGLRYREGWRTMHIDGEMIPGHGGFIVYAGSIRRWRFPFNWRRITPREQDRIVSNIRRAFRASGRDISFDVHEGPSRSQPSTSYVVFGPDVFELRRQGVEILAPLLTPHGFRYEPGPAARGSGGPFARGAFVRDDRRLELSIRFALGEVLYRAAGRVLAHEDYMRIVVGRGHHAYPGFSDDPLDGFRHLAQDLERFATAFLSGSDDEFSRVVAEAKRTPRPTGFKALSNP